jgi:hypothetical protein
MDAVVQLVRNALCCIKDLMLFRDAGIHEPAQLPLPHPLNKTTRLEILIGITQFYAFASVSKSGLNLILSSRAKLRSVQNLLFKLQKQQQQQQQDKTPDVNGNSRNVTTATDLLLQRLQNDRLAAQRNLFVGMNVFCIGVAFFWLFANSFHVTETSWIGGVPALIHALTIMEIAMIPLLYYMVADTVALLCKSAVMNYVVGILRKCIVTDKNSMGVPLVMLTDETFSLLLDGGWTPFSPINAGASSEDDEEEAKSISKELANVVSELESWTCDNDSNNKNNINALIQSTADRIESRAVATRYEAYREFIYFLLNFVAFYGYMLGILVYYRNEMEDDEPLYVRTLKLGMGNADADWTGNFAGDMMWTIGEILCVLAFMPMRRFVFYTHLLAVSFFFCNGRAHDHPGKSCACELVDAKT